MAGSLRFAALLLCVGVFAAAAEDDTWQAEFKVNSLVGDSKPAWTETTMVIEVHPSWAPLGAARFREMVDGSTGYAFKGVRFFRVIQGFMAQFGLPAKSEMAAVWREKKLTDDPVRKMSACADGSKCSNKKGTITFATSGKDSRTTQLFINFSDNANLDGMGFSAFGEVISGFDSCVDKIYAEHGETPDQGQIQSNGNKYLKRAYPNLSFISSARVLPKGEEVAEPKGDKTKEL